MHCHRHLAICALIAFCEPVLASQSEVQLKDIDGRPAVMATINHAVAVEFVIDTGASVVYLPENVIGDMWRRLILQEADFIGVGKSTLSDGSQRRSDCFKLRRLQIGSALLRDITACSLPQGREALLGMNVLGQIRWRIDYGKGVLVLADDASEMATSRSSASGAIELMRAYYNDLNRKDLAAAAQKWIQAPPGFGDRFHEIEYMRLAEINLLKHNADEASVEVYVSFSILGEKGSWIRIFDLRNVNGQWRIVAMQR